MASLLTMASILTMASRDRRPRTGAPVTPTLNLPLTPHPNPHQTAAHWLTCNDETLYFDGLYTNKLPTHRWPVFSEAVLRAHREVQDHPALTLTRTPTSTLALTLTLTLTLTL